MDQCPELDPFIGSGTTAVVAEERGLDWVGIDVSVSYLGMASTRIAAARRGAAERSSFKKPPRGMAGV